MADGESFEKFYDEKRLGEKHLDDILRGIYKEEQTIMGKKVVAVSDKELIEMGF
jgi:hypothetical protein